MNRTKNMTQGNPTGLIFSFALPLIIGNLGQQVYMITDTIIVGQGVGIGALAALGATDWIYWLVLWTVQSITQGFAILVTQNIGLDHEASIKKSIAMSGVLCLIIGISISVIMPFLAEPLLRGLQTPADIFNGARAYVQVMYAGTLIVIAYNMTSAVLRAFGDGKTPLIAMVIAAVVNISLDLLFVMVFEWGILGAAVATIISQLVSFLYCLAVIRKIPAVKMDRNDWQLDRSVLYRLLKLGFPLALQNVAIVFGGIVLQFVINGYGSLFIAGFTATNKLNGILESSAISFGFAASTYVAQNWGANQIGRIDAGVRSALKLCVLFAGVIGMTMIFLGKYLLMLFISSSDPNASQVLETAWQYLFILSITLILVYFLHVYRSALQGLGNTIAPMISGFLECIARMGVAFLLPAVLGETGLFFAESTAWLFCVVYVAFSYYQSMRRIHKYGLRFAVEEGIGVV